MTRKPKPARKKPPAPLPASPDKKHLDALLDEAIEETFPASDQPAMLDPLGHLGTPRRTRGQ